MRSGADHCDHTAKADAQVAGDRRHAERAYGEVIFVRKDFNGDSVFEVKPVFSTKFSLGATEQTKHATSIDDRFS